MTINTDIEFDDLSDDRKEELIDWVKETLLERWEEEAKKSKEFRTVKSWQEAYCRMEDIQWDMWGTEEEAKDFDWELAVAEEAEEEAEKKLFKAFH